MNDLTNFNLEEKISKINVLTAENRIEVRKMLLEVKGNNNNKGDND